jgi:hypothetical protein
MELRKNLLKTHRKSILRISIGYAFIAVTIILLISKYRQNIEIGMFDWFFILIFILNGIYIIIEGSGTSIENLLGKAFISINDETITTKATIFKKEQTINWKDIKTINLKSNRILIDNIMTTNLSNLENYEVKEINEVLMNLAMEKGVKVNN